MLYPLVHEHRLAGDIVAIGEVGVGQIPQPLDRIPQFRRDTFVGVDPEYPIARRLRIGELMFVLITLKFAVKYLIRERPGQLHRPVRRVRIHDHDLIRPRNTLANMCDIRLFITHDHRNRNLHRLNSRTPRPKTKRGATTAHGTTIFGVV